jgi:ubiquinone/menaquinone biosynthesis C-methylase UbiE
MFKADWLESLHTLRKKEINIIFCQVIPKAFNNMLELGCGDGFQTQLLIKYAQRITAADFEPKRFTAEVGQNISFKQCDAEELGKCFENKSFDVIYSSSLLEHLQDPAEALRSISLVLKDEGVTIHCMPNSLWKLSQIVLFYPNLFILLLSKILKIFNVKSEKPAAVSKSFDNNPKTVKSRTSMLIPHPHGAYPSNMAEFSAFSKRRWLKEFQDAGFDVIKVIACPISSGYGFGFNIIKSVLEYFGFTTSYAYVAVKKGQKSPYKEYFK